MRRFKESRSNGESPVRRKANVSIFLSGSYQSPWSVPLLNVGGWTAILLLWFATEVHAGVVFGQVHGGYNKFPAKVECFIRGPGSAQSERRIEIGSQRSFSIFLTPGSYTVYCIDNDTKKREVGNIQSHPQPIRQDIRLPDN